VIDVTTQTLLGSRGSLEPREGSALLRPLSREKQQSLTKGTSLNPTDRHPSFTSSQASHFFLSSLLSSLFFLLRSSSSFFFFIFLRQSCLVKGHMFFFLLFSTYVSNQDGGTKNLLFLLPTRMKGLVVLLALLGLVSAQSFAGQYKTACYNANPTGSSQYTISTLTLGSTSYTNQIDGYPSTGCGGVKLVSFNLRDLHNRHCPRNHHDPFQQLWCVSHECHLQHNSQSLHCRAFWYWAWTNYD